MTENLKVNVLIVAVSGVAWVSAFALQERFLSLFSHAPGIDLVFIPSGVRLIAILIGGIWAVVGIGLGGLVLTGREFHTMQPGIIALVAACGGLFPYLALRASLWATGVDWGLRKLTAVRLPLICLGVALGSSVLHNVLFGLLGLEAWPSFSSNTTAMAAGDFIGTLLAVLVVFLALRILRRRSG
ncbi:hypothetical protein DK847_01270 [Aestuariivirga litoralis]|uniref:MASE1 domain-containing protein n=1 Tax=Aestuariivirga litoralis TaxID=2650924 RepID=A0A2W2BYD6_9HYPH|nr:hypothetical protein [Aestuariivirga litoralis]PZF78476.1 hypothetical protein DK847_01270 [Aestuariivirga litoralis]